MSPERLVLPAVVDTLTVLRLAGAAGAGARSGDLAVDASGVERIGVAGLQWLAALRADRERQGRCFGFAGVSSAFAEQVRDAGFAKTLLGEAAPPAEGRLLDIRFADRALLFGGEPLNGLAALRRAGASLRAEPLPMPAEAGVDAIAFRFRAILPSGLGEREVAAILTPFEDSCELLWDGAEPDRSGPATPPPDHPPAEPASSAPIRPAAGALAGIAGQLDELVTAQAALIEAIGPRRATLATEIAAVERVAQELQMRVAEAGAVPLADALGLPFGAWRWEGEPLAVEGALAARLAAPLRALLRSAPSGGTIFGEREGGFALLRIAPAPAVSSDLAATLAALGGEVAAEEDALLLRMPHFLALLDALLVEVGAGCYALPVAAMIEALRPEPAALHRLGNRAMLRYEGGYVPIVSLGRFLGAEGWQADPLRAALVVVRVAGRQRAILVDSISAQRQLRVKPIEGLGRVNGIAGAALVQGSRVALVVDIAALIRAG